MITDEEFRAAEARLFQLLEQGVIHSIGAMQQDHRAEFFVGVDAQTEPRADDYDAHKLSLIRGRLKEVLQEIPFSILGDYSENLHSAVNSALPDKKDVQLSKDVTGVDLLSSAPADLEPYVTSRTQHSSQSESSDSDIYKELVGMNKVIHSAIDPVRADSKLLAEKIDTLKIQITDLENKLEMLPSRGLVVTVAITTVALIVPSILFQGHGPILLLALRKLFGM